MSNLLPVPYQSEILLLHPTEHEFSGRKREGKIAVAQIDADGRWSEKLLRLPQLLEHINDLHARQQVEELFFSINAFKFSRRHDNVTELRAFFVDIDCYEQLLIPGFVPYLIEELSRRELVPLPNIICYSGRGIWALWLLHPAPRMAVPLWMTIEKQIIKNLSYLGVDPRACDVGRVMRIPGSINVKAGAEVTWKVWHHDLYRLEEVAKMILPERKPRKVYKSKSKEETPVHRKFFNLYSLHDTIIEDLKRLADLRGHQLRGHREFFLFIWRNCLARLDAHPEDSEKILREIAIEFLGDDRLPDREWMQATMSAHRAKHTTKDGKAKQGYTLSAQWIIEKLEITEDEQRRMQVLIGRKEKYRRNNKRRSTQSKAEFLADLEDKRRLVLSLREQHPTVPHRQIAELAGVSVDTVRRIFRFEKSKVCNWALSI